MRVICQTHGEIPRLSLAPLLAGDTAKVLAALLRHELVHVEHG